MLVTKLHDDEGKQFVLTGWKCSKVSVAWDGRLGVGVERWFGSCSSILCVCIMYRRREITPLRMDRVTQFATGLATD